MLASMAAATFVAALAKPLVGRAAATSDKADSTAPVRWVPGMELYTLGLKPTDDIAGAFKALAAIGYREVEFSGPYDRTAAELRRALDAAGLTGPAAHALPRPAKGAWDLGDVSKFAADLHTLGARYGVVPIPLLPSSRSLLVAKHQGRQGRRRQAPREQVSRALEPRRRRAPQRRSQLHPVPP